MISLIYGIIIQDWFLQIYDAFRTFFVDHSELPGDEVCYLLTWLSVVAFFWICGYLVTRVISFIFRGRL